jgi:hypothetical protein
MEAFHAAISANPSSPAAAAGLERLEKLMRGIDPDDEEGVGGEGAGVGMEHDGMEDGD